MGRGDRTLPNGDDSVPMARIVASASVRECHPSRSPTRVTGKTIEYLGGGPPDVPRRLSVSLSDDVVTLRRWSRDDAGFIADASGDPEIQRYSVPHDRRGHPSPPLSIADAEALIDEFAARWRASAATGRPSGVTFAITEARSGELAGMCGVDNWSDEDVVQIGYWLAPRARGRGYATRAVILLTRWLFELGAARVFLTIVAGNEPSVEVARRAGFVYEGTMRSHSVWRDERCDVMWFAALPTESTVP
jgi:RimJ/RimL family protein N-acetyltransferase